MKAKKLLFLTLILMMLTSIGAVAQRGTCTTTGTLSDQYYRINGTQTHDYGSSTTNATIPTVPIGALVQVGMRNNGTELDNASVADFTIDIYKDGVFQNQIKKNVGSYGSGWQPTIPASNFTIGAVVRAVMTVTPGSTFNGCSVGNPWTYTYNFNTSTSCIPNAAATFYYNNNIGSNWVDPATISSGNITIPGLISLGAAANVYVGAKFPNGSSVTYTDGLGFSVTKTGSGSNVQYYPNFVYNATAAETRTLTATVASNCPSTPAQVVTFTITSANTCTPSTVGNSFFNIWDGAGYHDSVSTRVSNNVAINNVPFGSFNIRLGLHLNGSSTVSWSDASGVVNTTGEFNYPTNLAPSEVKVVTASVNDGCGTITPITYTLTAAASCIPAAYTPYYNSNDGTSWHNAPDASPINLNAEVGNTITLGINPTITALWTDGIALNQTNAQFDYVPGFTGAGQTRDVVASFTDNCGNAKSYTFHITSVITKTTWDGTAWSYSTPPTTTIEAIIAGAFSTTTNGAISAKKLTVNSGASLTINTGTNVAVQNEVINNGSVVVENNANLIQVNNTTNMGNVKVNRNSNALSRLDYTMWASPVASQLLSPFSPMTSQSPSRFYTYDSAANLYSAVASPTTTNFAAGTGYLIRMPNTAVDFPATETFAGVFTGVPNNGNVSLSGLTSSLYYAIGNPYPSTISAESFLAGNATDGVLYFWRKTNAALGSAYATYTLGGATTTTPTSAVPNGTIQVGQGFIVKTGGATLNFTNAMRLSSSSTQFFKTKQVVERDRVWLNLTNTAGVFSQALVGYMDGATQGIDAGIDGAYINDSPVALTSNINNEEYTIQGRALPFDASDVVPLNFKTDIAGDYTIAIDHADGLFATGQDVYLVDSTTGTETNLKTDAYTFTATTGTANSRFSLKYQKILKVDAPAFNENSVTVYKNGGTLYVNSVACLINNIKVFDVQGRLIAEQKNVKANSATIKDLKATQQVLIVKITSQDNAVVNKKVVN